MIKSTKANGQQRHTILVYACLFAPPVDIAAAIKEFPTSIQVVVAAKLAESVEHSKIIHKPFELVELLDRISHTGQQKTQTPKPIKHQNLKKSKPANQKVALLMLKKWGVQADLAENAQIAVEAVCNHDDDIIRIDMQMLGLDRFAATRKIRLKLNT